MGYSGFGVSWVNPCTYSPSPMMYKPERQCSSPLKHQYSSRSAQKLPNVKKKYAKQASTFFSPGAPQGGRRRKKCERANSPPPPPYTNPSPGPGPCASALKITRSPLHRLLVSTAACRVHQPSEHSFGGSFCTRCLAMASWSMRMPWRRKRSARVRRCFSRSVGGPSPPVLYPPPCLWPCSCWDPGLRDGR